MTAKDDSSLTDVAYEAILCKILDGSLRGGERVQERRLAEMLNQSRTPIREALGRLEAEGLILRENRLSTVRTMTVTEYVGLLHVRRLLEAEAAGLACTRILDEELSRLRQRVEAILAGEAVDAAAFDRDLHDTILRHSGNETLTSIVQQLRRKTAIFDARRIPGRAVPVATEHLAIIEAMERRDPQAARQAAAQHIDNIRNSVIDWISNIGAWQSAPARETP